MSNPGVIAYVTGFNINTYPRPLFIKHALGGDSLKLYRLRTIIGYLYGKDELTDMNTGIEGIVENQVNSALRAGKNMIYMLPRMRNCARIDRVDEFTALLIESLYMPFFEKVHEKTVIVLNTVGAFAAMKMGKRVIIDLMDLWSCDPEGGLRMNALDYYVLRRAWQVWAWSKAITALLRRIGISNVKYVPSA